MDNPPDQHPIENAAEATAASVVIQLSTREISVTSDLPRQLPVDSAEIALLRAFLSDDIRAIMQDEE